MREEHTHEVVEKTGSDGEHVRTETKTENGTVTEHRTEEEGPARQVQPDGR